MNGMEIEGESWAWAWASGDEIVQMSEEVRRKQVASSKQEEAW